MKKKLLSALILAGVAYPLFAFTGASLNPFQWSELLRFIWALTLFAPFVETNKFKQI